MIDPVVAYSTLLGRSGDELGLTIAVDAEGHVYVTGRSDSSDFPTSAGARLVYAAVPIRVASGTSTSCPVFTS